MADNKLYYGDNLEVLAKLPSESVDLVYLDPPFNSARNYNVIFARNGDSATDAGAQIQAFTDTWTWTHATDLEYQECIEGGVPARVADALTAFRTLLGENDALAYLVNMAPRLVQLHRVLRSTGSLYLHCDPTMSHYLKMLLDAIFDPRGYINEIIWERSSTRSSISRIYRRAHDVILFYAKSSDYQFDIQFRPLSGGSLSAYSKSDERGRYQGVPLLVSGLRNGATGRPWRGIDPATRGKGGMHWITVPEKLEEYDRQGLILWPNKEGGSPRLKYYEDQTSGTPINDVWTDIKLISSSSAEALGYPTQKPLALLERILEASSNPGDVVLDPFAGCGTTVDAAQKLGRRWIGIDITYIAVDLIEKRLLHAHGPSITSTYDVRGIPRDAGSAQALFDRNPFDFERWAVAQVNAQPNEKQVGDRGIDGVARFMLGGKNEFGKILVSVKGGRQLNPAMVRDLSGTVETQKAAMGILITQHEPTRGMIEAVNHGGSYMHPANGQAYPRLQIVTTTELLAGKRPQTPPTVLPYIAASAQAANDTSITMF